MNFKTVASAASIVTLLFGLSFIVAPLTTLAIYGNQSADPVLAVMARYFGAALAGFAALAWGLRGVESQQAQSTTAKLVALTTLVGAGVSLQAVLAGTLNAMAWSSVAIYITFAALWARIGFIR